MRAELLSDGEVAVVDGWLHFNREAAALRLDETPWWRFSERSARRQQIAILDSMRQGLAKANPIEAERAAQVAARTG